MRKKDLDNFIHKVFSMPMIQKYQGGTASLYDYSKANNACLIIPLLSNARKNYFDKTINELRKSKIVHLAMYEKAQDATVSDIIAIYFN